METKATRKKTATSGFWQQGKVDVVFACLVGIILLIGLLMLFSASYAYSLTYFGDSYRFILRQGLFALVGIGLMKLFSSINYHFWRKFAWVIYGISVALLAILLIMPPMIEGVEYKRWFVIGSFSFQPSEIAKFSIILLFSHLIAKNYNKMKTFKFGILKLGALLLIVCILVVVETHLSATILIFSIGVVLMIVGGVKFKYIGIGIGGGVALAATAILTGVVSYGSSRIQYWLDPWADATGKGYQTIQSLLAIGSGGLLGRGIGQSRQKYLWVPEPHNDFIFSIVCEELGFIGAVIIILLFCALVWRGFTIAMNAPDKFGSLLAVGLTFQVGIQMVLNILVVTNTIPNTGISLPFFSYGGTANFFFMISVGMILSVSRTGRKRKTVKLVV